MTSYLDYPIPILQTTGEKVVLKESQSLNPSAEFMDRWYGELKILKRLHHKNIVQVLDMPLGLQYQPVTKMPFFCMEYCDKGDLRQVRVKKCYNKFSVG